MSMKESSNRVISLTRKREERDGSSMKKPRRTRRSNARVIAITSGKGGVGKTSIVGNLGYALTKLGKKVLILDADLGLGNLDVLLGLAPKYNLSHVILGEKTIEDIIVEGPGKMRILPASSGIQELTHLNKDQKIQILTQLDLLIESVDILFIDTAAGISSNVMDFNATAQEVVVVVSPEPTSITDAYALMKVLSLKYSGKDCKLMVNMVSRPEEGREVFRQLQLVTDRFLDMMADASFLLLDSLSRLNIALACPEDIFPSLTYFLISSDNLNRRRLFAIAALLLPTFTLISSWVNPNSF